MCIHRVPNDAQFLTEYYETFYRKGGWVYTAQDEKDFLCRRIIEPLELAEGLRLLDLGCGMGLHSYLLAKLKFKVTGIDQSKTAIKYARKHFDGPLFFNMNAENMFSIFQSGSFDIIFTRNMSWYLYELDGRNVHGIDIPGVTAKLFGLLGTGGLFVNQTYTNFSKIKDNENGYNNTFGEFVELFGHLGEIVLISDWSGRILSNQSTAKDSGNGMIIATRKRDWRQTGLALAIK